MGVEGMMAPHPYPTPASEWLQGCRGAGAAVEWLPHLCKRFPSGEMGPAAVRLLINSAQLWIERMSASFGLHLFQCRGGMKCCH